MNMEAFTLDEKSRPTPIAPEDLSQEWLIDGVPRWIDVEAAECEKNGEATVDETGDPFHRLRAGGTRSFFSIFRS